ncbi:MAG: lipocalin family protein [Cloacibacterium sp.]|jgi:hypothetical protein|nr:lipocalin family protein [Cloacibacterium sp.]
MKKIILFLVGVFLLTNSCSRDDNSSGSETSIVGKWQLSHTVLNGTVTYNGAVANVKDFKVNATDCQKKSYMLFKNDGTGNEEAWLENEGSCQLKESGAYTYSYNSSTREITETYNGVSVKVALKSLTSSELAYSQAINKLDTGNGVFTGTGDVYFVKVSN